ncbi:MAG: PxKF domain-containing protein [Candidatus Thorarchaeota archaeon]
MFDSWSTDKRLKIVMFLIVGLLILFSAPLDSSITMTTELAELQGTPIVSEFVQGVSGQVITTDITLTEDILVSDYVGLVIGASGITIDGAGHKIIGNGMGVGIGGGGQDYVTIKNLVITGFEAGIILNGSWGCNILQNYLTDNDFGLWLATNFTIVERNIITNNGLGIRMDAWSYNFPGTSIRIAWGYSNQIHLNLLINNDDQIQPAGEYNLWYEPSLGLGNFWSNYWGDDLDNDDIGDTDLPHEGVDDYPLLDPTIPERYGELPVGDDWWETGWIVWRGDWSPVSIKVIDNLGRTISDEENQIGLNAWYVEDNQWEPSKTMVMVIIATPPTIPTQEQVYSFQMTALDDLTYSMEWFASFKGDIFFERSAEDVSLTAGQTRAVETAVVENSDGTWYASPLPQYTFSGILQPIDADGSSIFKQGRTVPVKFHLFDDNGLSVSTAHATIEVEKISNEINGELEDVASTSAADTGNVFRYDSETEQYIFNLSTKELETGTYVLRITLDDGQIFEIQFSLK